MLESTREFFRDLGKQFHDDRVSEVDMQKALAPHKTYEQFEAERKAKEAQEKAKKKEEEKQKIKALNDLKVMYERNGYTKFDEWLKAIAPEGMTNEIYAVEMARLKKELTDKAEQTKGKGKA